MAGGYRSIDWTDYERVYAVLHALEQCREEPGTPAWEHLVALHEQKVEIEARVATDTLAGDAGFNAEFHRALVLLEILKRGGDQIPIHVEAIRRVCSTPGCGQTTMGVLCPACELDCGPR